jgi:hypothetical protein
MTFDPRESIRETSSKRACDHEECSEEGTHRAPMRGGQTGQYHWFCIKHVREYNKSWNYFEGMSDAEVEAYRHNTNTWHRPTWSVTGKSRRTPTKQAIFDGIDDQFGLFRDDPLGMESLAIRRPKKRVPGPVAKALRRLGMSTEATPQEVKIRYKELAKRFHPDLNGGNKEAEERLKRINEAYSYLLSAGHA